MKHRINISRKKQLIQGLTMIQKAQGQSIEGNDDHWVVECPNCSKEFEYERFFDPDDITDCPCGTKFKTEKVWLNDDTYIQ